MSNYYQILELGHQASGAEIRASYLRLAKTLHPDLHPEKASALEDFKALQEAYRILSHPELREAYDEFLHGFEDEGHAEDSQEHLEAFAKAQYQELWVPVSWVEACLGCVKSIEVSSIDPSSSEATQVFGIQVPSSARHGQSLHFISEGTEELLGLRPRLKLLVPGGLTRRQRQILQEFERSSLPGDYPKRQAFLSAHAQD